MVKKFYRKFQNYIVPSNIKHNFLDLTHQNRELISKKIKEVYIPTFNYISNDSFKWNRRACRRKNFHWS